MPTRSTEDLLHETQELEERMTALTQSDDFDPTSEDWLRLQSRGASVKAQLDAVGIAQAQAADFANIRSSFGQAPAAPDLESITDIGDALVRSQSFRNYVRGGATGSHRLMDIPFNLRATLTTAAFPSVKQRIVAAEPNRQNPLLNALNRQQVSSNSVEVVTYPSAAPLAGVVAEGTLKPEAAMTIAISTVTLETLAHWKEATRQLLEDEARMRDFISGNLIRGVTDKAEAQAAAVITAGTYAPAAGATMAEAIRVAVANVQSAGYSPNAVLINPIDAAALDLNVWTVSTGSPSMNGSIWGVQMVPVGAIAAGSAYVGDFSSAVDFLYRSNVALYVTDSDVNAVDFSSNFKKNIITFLAEMRAKAVVTRPEAISKATPSGGLVALSGQSAPTFEEREQNQRKALEAEGDQAKDAEKRRADEQKQAEQQQATKPRR